MGWTKIDRANWKREAYFRHYHDEAPCFYSMTVSLDVTRLREAGLKLYPAMLYALSAAVNSHAEFRTAMVGGEVGVYDALWPCYTVFHPQTETFSNLWTAYRADYAGSTRVAEDLGYMPAPVREYSEDGETPVHLDGLQAVGYARIRKLDSDFVRTSRQRRVVQAVMTALRGQLYNPLVYARIADVLCNNLETNMNAVEIASLGMKALVCGEIEQMRLPVDGTYDDNGSSITIDASANAQALREFIYD